MEILMNTFDASLLLKLKFDESPIFGIPMWLLNVLVMDEVENIGWMKLMMG